MKTIITSICLLLIAAGINCQSVLLLQDANLAIAEGNSFSVVASMTPVPADILEGSTFDVILSDFLITGAVTTSIFESDTKVRMNSFVFPNPTDREINIEIVTEHSSLITGAIYSLDGQLHLSRTTRLLTGENLIQYDLSYAVDGIYFLVLRNENNEILGTFKFIKS